MALSRNKRRAIAKAKRAKALGVLHAKAHSTYQACVVEAGRANDQHHGKIVRTPKNMVSPIYHGDWAVRANGHGTSYSGGLARDTRVVATRIIGERRKPAGMGH